jgi:very-short-patch-repair endonuclease
MSDLERILAWQLRAAGVPFEQEVCFAPPRKWRADFAFSAARLLVEVEGGVWTGGRHTTGAGFVADISKYNAACLGGYRLLRVTGDMVKDGRALALIEQALQAAAPATVVTVAAAGEGA